SGRRLSVHARTAFVLSRAAPVARTSLWHVATALLYRIPQECCGDRSRGPAPTAVLVGTGPADLHPPQFKGFAIFRGRPRSGGCNEVPEFSRGGVGCLPGFRSRIRARTSDGDSDRQGHVGGKRVAARRDRHGPVAQ